MQAAAPDNINIHVPTIQRTWALLSIVAGVALSIVVGTWTVSQMLNERDKRIEALERDSRAHVTKEQVTEAIMTALSRMTIQCDKNGDESRCTTWFSPAAAQGVR